MEDNLQNKATNKLFDKYSSEEQDLGYLLNQIENKKIKPINNNNGQGMVYKVDYDGYLKLDGYELSYLILSKDAVLNEELDNETAVQYTPLIGSISVDGNYSSDVRFMIGEKHALDKVTKKTIIKSCKVSKRIIDIEMIKMGYRVYKKKND